MKLKRYYEPPIHMAVMVYRKEDSVIHPIKKKADLCPKCSGVGVGCHAGVGWGGSCSGGGMLWAWMIIKGGVGHAVVGSGRQ